MSELYDSLRKGFQEAISDAKSINPQLKRRAVTVLPVQKYNAEEIKRIRRKTGFSQRLFADYLGVSHKTVEAWEAGVNHPSGCAGRLLYMLDSEANLLEQFPFVKQERER